MRFVLCQHDGCLWHAMSNAISCYSAACGWQKKWRENKLTSFARQVSRKIEMVFMESNRRDIVKYLENKEAKAESAKADAKKSADSVSGNGDADQTAHDEEKPTFDEDDGGNWKRRKVAKDDDDEDDEPAAEGEYGNLFLGPVL